MNVPRKVGGANHQDVNPGLEQNCSCELLDEKRDHGSIPLRRMCCDKCCVCRQQNPTPQSISLDSISFEIPVSGRYIKTKIRSTKNMHNYVAKNTIRCHKCDSGPKKYIMQPRYSTRMLYKRPSKTRQKARQKRRNQVRTEKNAQTYKQLCNDGESTRDKYFRLFGNNQQRVNDPSYDEIKQPRGSTNNEEFQQTIRSSRMMDDPYKNRQQKYTTCDDQTCGPSCGCLESPHDPPNGLPESDSVHFKSTCYNRANGYQREDHDKSERYIEPIRGVERNNHLTDDLSKFIRKSFADNPDLKHNTEGLQSENHANKFQTNSTAKKNGTEKVKESRDEGNHSYKETLRQQVTDKSKSTVNNKMNDEDRWRNQSFSKRNECQQTQHGNHQDDKNIRNPTTAKNIKSTKDKNTGCREEELKFENAKKSQTYPKTEKNGTNNMRGNPGEDTYRNTKQQKNPNCKRESIMNSQINDTDRWKNNKSPNRSECQQRTYDKSIRNPATAQTIKSASDKSTDSSSVDNKKFKCAKKSQTNPRTEINRTSKMRGNPGEDINTYRNTKPNCKRESIMNSQINDTDRWKNNKSPNRSECQQTRYDKSIRNPATAKTIKSASDKSTDSSSVDNKKFKCAKKSQTNPRTEINKTNKVKGIRDEVTHKCSKTLQKRETPIGKSGSITNRQKLAPGKIHNCLNLNERPQTRYGNHQDDKITGKPVTTKNVKPANEKNTKDCKGWLITENAEKSNPKPTVVKTGTDMMKDKRHEKIKKCSKTLQPKEHVAPKKTSESTTKNQTRNGADRWKDCWFPDCDKYQSSRNDNQNDSEDISAKNMRSVEDRSTDTGSFERMIMEEKLSLIPLEKKATYEIPIFDSMSSEFSVYSNSVGVQDEKEKEMHTVTYNNYKHPNLELDVDEPKRGSFEPDNPARNDTRNRTSLERTFSNFQYKNTSEATPFTGTKPKRGECSRTENGNNSKSSADKSKRDANKYGRTASIDDRTQRELNPEEIAYEEYKKQISDKCDEIFRKYESELRRRNTDDMKCDTLGETSGEDLRNQDNGDPCHWGKNRNGGTWYNDSPHDKYKVSHNDSEGVDSDYNKNYYSRWSDILESELEDVASENSNEFKLTSQMIAELEKSRCSCSCDCHGGTSSSEPCMCNNEIPCEIQVITEFHFKDPKKSKRKQIASCGSRKYNASFYEESPNPYTIKNCSLTASPSYHEEDLRCGAELGNSFLTKQAPRTREQQTNVKTQRRCEKQARNCISSNEEANQRGRDNCFCCNDSLALRQQKGLPDSQPKKYNVNPRKK